MRIKAIIEAYRACYRGGAPAASIWECAGLDGSSGVEDEYLERYELNPGVFEFLETMRASSTPVFGLSNDVGEWTRKRLPRLGLDGLFAGWIVSSDVRSTKPQLEIYARLVEILPCASEDCVFVDDRDVNLSGAREAGLRTLLFGAARHDDFEAVEDFAALTSRLERSVR